MKPIPRQDEHETLETLFQNVDLSLAETQARECFHSTARAVNKVRGLRNVAVYALYSVLCHVLTREAAENMGRPDKAVSPTFFNT